MKIMVMDLVVTACLAGLVGVCFYRFHKARKKWRAAAKVREMQMRAIQASGPFTKLDRDMTKLDDQMDALTDAMTALSASAQSQLASLTPKSWVGLNSQHQHQSLGYQVVTSGSTSNMIPPPGGSWQQYYGVQTSKQPQVTLGGASLWGMFGLSQYKVKIDVGGAGHVGLVPYLKANYGIDAMEHDGLFICEPLRLIMKFDEPSKITEMPKLTRKCRWVELKNTTLTRFELEQMLNTILIYNDDKTLPIPVRQYDSVGYDLSCAEDADVAPGEMKDISTGIYCAFPVHIWGMLTSRSSTFRRRLTLPVSVIDPGFQGELKFCVHNTGVEMVHITKGERLGQMIPIVDPHGVRLEQVENRDEFPTTDRGTKGFGSTGV